MATTYLSPQQLKDFAQRVEEVAKKFPGEVVRIRHSFSRDWDGDPAIYFRIVFTDGAVKRYPLSELTHRIERRADQRLGAFHVGILSVHSVLQLPNQVRAGAGRKILNGSSRVTCWRLAAVWPTRCPGSRSRLLSEVDIYSLLRAFSSSGSGRGPVLEWFLNGTIWFGTKVRSQDHEGSVQFGLAGFVARVEHSLAIGTEGIGDGRTDIC